MTTRENKNLLPGGHKTVTESIFKMFCRNLLIVLLSTIWPTMMGPVPSAWPSLVSILVHSWQASFVNANLIQPLESEEWSCPPPIHPRIFNNTTFHRYILNNNPTHQFQFHLHLPRNVHVLLLHFLNSVELSLVDSDRRENVWIAEIRVGIRAQAHLAGPDQRMGRLSRTKE